MAKIALRHLLLEDRRHIRSPIPPTKWNYKSWILHVKQAKEC